MAADFHAHPGQSIPQNSESPAAAKAAYRLVEGGSITAQDAFYAHADAVTKRVKESPEQVLLVAQDTTSLNFATRPNTTGLGPIGNKAESGQGFFVHSSLCIGAQGGEVFGLLGAEMWARDAKQFKAGPAGARNRKPIEEKESFRWLQSWQKAQKLYEQLGGSRQVVSVSDREGDIYEAFALCLDTKERNGGGADLLVRAQHDRQQVGETGRASWEHIEGKEEVVIHTIDVPRSHGKPARKTKLELRWGKVELAVPAHKTKYLGLEKPLTLWLIVATEVSPPEGEEPICWRLWTTLEIDTAQCAIQTMGWYARRWQIEEFHRILKSGCKSENRQLESLERLSLVVSLDMVVAACILGLTKAARNQPQACAQAWLSDEQWMALHCYINKTHIVPQEPPNLITAVKWLARLGGFLGRKSDGFPGPQVLWRGWRRLEDITATFNILRNQETCGQ